MGVPMRVHAHSREMSEKPLVQGGTKVMALASKVKDLLHYRFTSFWKKEEYILATLLDLQIKQWIMDIKQQEEVGVRPASFPSHAAAVWHKQWEVFRGHREIL